MQIAILWNAHRRLRAHTRHAHQYTANEIQDCNTSELRFHGSRIRLSQVGTLCPRLCMGYCREEEFRFIRRKKNRSLSARLVTHSGNSPAWQHRVLKYLRCQETLPCCCGLENLRP